MTDKVLRRSLSEMQGARFEMSGVEGYDSETFIRVFMHSKISEGLDSDFDYTQWAGKEYIMERMKEEYPEGFSKQGIVFDSEDDFLSAVGFVLVGHVNRTGLAFDEEAVDLDVDAFARDGEVAIDFARRDEAVHRRKDVFGRDGFWDGGAIRR